MPVTRSPRHWWLYIVLILCIDVNNYFVSADPWRLYSSVDKKESNEIPRINSADVKQKQDQISASLSWRSRVAKKNLAIFDHPKINDGFLSTINDQEVIAYKPGDAAASFVLYTLRGKLEFPLGPLDNTSALFTVYNNQSGFLETLWNSNEALRSLTSDKTPDVNYVIIPADDADPVGEAKWLQSRVRSQVSATIWAKIESKFHFVIQSVSQLGNWIPACLKEWRCVDHGCGFNQVVIHSNNSDYPVVLKRVDARYDWLPSPVKFGNKTLPLIFAEDGCQQNSSVAGAIALVSDVGCTYYEKIVYMAASSAIGVIIYVSPGHQLKDMNCENEECDAPIPIPASMVPFSPSLFRSRSVQFQNTPSDSFHMAIDPRGRLNEVGWFLYPSASFLVWQAQWMAFKERLEQKLEQEAKVVPLFENAIMKGKRGVLVNVTLPPLEELRNFSKFELHADLSCPGTKDTTCPHWDRTVSLYVCCDPNSPLCGMELGRWISPFRRRIGSWLTDVSPLLPLLSSRQCTFHMYTDPWAAPWKPSINLRFSNLEKPSDMYPAEARVLYEPGATFDSNYNNHFKPFSFNVSKEHTKVVIYAVITGHGSDENGCGEFCITSHHFIINSKWHSIKFSNAGTPLGCTEKVREGAVPNEHGTWLYGRDGWCDGLQVNPWVIDISKDISRTQTNTIKYLGMYNHTTPNPKKNPGIISLYSYLILYKKS